MINISEIIRETMPETLWSNVIGKCTLKEVGEDGSITVEFKSYSSSFSKYGEFVQSSKMCNLFPSEKMQDWNKFVWKIGDVLVTKKGGFRVIFDSWANDSYTEFYGYFFEGSESCVKKECYTENFIKSDNPKSIEWCYNKMNELKYKYPVLANILPNSRQEFKDGDIVFVTGAEGYKDYIEIFSYFDDGEIYDHALYDIKKAILDCSGEYPIGEYEYQDIRLATDSEKQQLFDALTKENKAWDAEKKRIVSLPKFEFKPFDKVLVRDAKDEIWHPRFFAYYVNDMVICMDESEYTYCIPYNEETKHLVGTIDKYKED